ncbi:MAG: hypothetical protein U0324_15120 [Polyangiales bacterium]
MSDLKLNDLDRYRKRSDSLILQEYSHCEVPAGCGGVVLRWVDLDEAVPLTVYAAAAGGIALSLDGVAVPSALLNVPLGDRVVGMCITGGQPEATTVQLAGVYRPNPLRYDEAEHQVLLCSRADVPWRAVTRKPPDGWDTLGFDDRAWSELTPLPGSSSEALRWNRQRVEKYGAVALGLPSYRGRLWVRAPLSLRAGAVRP